jgi:hypothetical protein
MSFQRPDEGTLIWQYRFLPPSVRCMDEAIIPQGDPTIMGGKGSHAFLGKE